MPIAITVPLVLGMCFSHMSHSHPGVYQVTHTQPHYAEISYYEHGKSVDYMTMVTNLDKLDIDYVFLRIEPVPCPSNLPALSSIQKQGDESPARVTWSLKEVAVEKSNCHPGSLRKTPDYFIPTAPDQGGDCGGYSIYMPRENHDPIL